MSKTTSNGIFKDDILSLDNFEKIVTKDGLVLYKENFFDKDYFSELSNEKNWEVFKIKFYGKIIDQPRESLYMAENSDLTYTYSKVKRKPHKFSKCVKEILDSINKVISKTHTKLNAVLGNKYRDGKDYISAHSYDESDMEKNSIIASVSFGAERDFIFKHKKTKEKIKIKLKSKSLLIMDYECQKHWTHELPKRLRVKDPRINLTFRSMKEKN